MFSSARVNLAPTASAGGPYQVSEGGSVALAASGSDPEGRTLSYAWDLNNDGIFETTGANATFSAAIDGPASVTVAMQVTDDGQLSDVDTAIITIVNVPPAVGAITLASGPFLIGESVAPSVTFADPGTADRHTAVWSWGDGTPDTVQVVELGTRSASADHVYAAPGSFAVGVTVTDDDGGAGSTQVMRTVIYKLCLRYDPDRPVRAGATIPIRLQICTAAGDNLSSAEVPLHVVSNPITDADFRFDPTLAGTGGYILNVITQGLAPGDYQVPFTAGNEAFRYVVSFRIR
jgi:PKD repeat protein